MDMTVLMTWTAILFAVATYFIKKWINATEKKTDDNAIALSNVTTQHSKEIAILVDKNQQEVKDVAKELARITAETAATIKDDLKEHRNENGKSTDEIKGILGRVFDQMREANGRTAKNETNIALQKRTCEERTIGTRKDDCTI